MKWCRFVSFVVLLAVLSPRARAGIFPFGKRSKTNAAERVPALINTLKTNPDAGKREEAAEQLRHFDTAAFPQIVPTLADSALGDPKPSVRIQALMSLSKIRPISQQAGWTMEQVMAKDTSWRVRAQARSSLWQYYMGGYRDSKGQPPVMNNVVAKPTPTGPVFTGEPPLADSPAGGMSIQPGADLPSAAPMMVSPPASPGLMSRPVARPVPYSGPQPTATTSEPPLLDPSTAGPELAAPR